jgi:hypothetical protein
MSKETSARDALRASLLGKKKRASRMMDLGDGITVEIRQPTVGARSRIMQAAGVTAGSQEISDLAALQISAVVHCCFVPETSERIFEAADSDVLRELPTNEWFDDVSAAALDLMNAEPEKAGKL